MGGYKVNYEELSLTPAGRAFLESPAAQIFLPVSQAILAAEAKAKEDRERRVHTSCFFDLALS